MSYVLAIIMAALGVAFVLGIRMYARVKARAAREYAMASEKFFEAVEPIVSDDESPQELLEAIEMFNDTITDKSVASHLASYPLHRQPSDRTLQWLKLINEFFGKRPELEKSFAEATGYWFIAVTALSPIPGAAARYAVTDDEIRMAATRVSRKKHCDDDNHGGPVEPHGALAA